MPVAIGLGAALLLWGVARGFSMRRTPAAVLAFVAAGGVVFALQLRAPLPAIPTDARVQIVSPQTGITVSSQHIEVVGSVEPREADVLIAVRSERANEWSIRPVGRPFSGERWRIVVPLGTAIEGVNENFSIVALAHSGNRPTEDREEWTLAVLPDWPCSNVVVVHRSLALAP